MRPTLAMWSLKRLFGQGPVRALGATSRAHAKLCVEREQRHAAAAPDGCVWLDPETIADLELERLSATIDRTVTPPGAQQLWRMLVAPAHRVDVLERRERIVEELAAKPELRRSLHTALAKVSVEGAAFIPHVLWGDAPQLPVQRWLCAALPMLLLASVLAAAWLPKLVLLAIALLFVNVLVDNHIKNAVQHQADAIVMMGRTLGVADRIHRDRAAPVAELEQLALELPALAGLRRRTKAWAVNDPTSAFEIVQSVLLIRANVLASCLAELASQRERLRRVYALVGELDALLSVSTLREELGSLVDIPRLATGAAHLEARDLRHPAVACAVGNDLVLDAESLVATGSNMAGKSTFMRTLATNAILAQSIHTVWGSWRASLFRVHAAMRASDDTSAQLSTYAAEVASIGRLVRAAEGTTPALLVVDEPFRGTDPAVRVPIVVAVLTYLAKAHVVIAATHDLDAAMRLPDTYVRGHFSETADTFDYKLRSGVARSSNALEILRRADYPQQIIEAIERTMR